MNLYEVLGVARDATREQVEAAFRRRVKEVHPDRGGDRAAYDAVALARRVLIDAELRRRYDEDGSLPDDKVDNVEAEALSVLAQALDEFATDEGPLLRKLVEAFEAALAALREKEQALRKKVSRLQERVAELRPKGKEDPLRGLLGNALRKVQEELRVEGARVAVYQRARKMLDEYKLEPEGTAAREHQLQQWDALFERAMRRAHAPGRRY